MDPTGAEGDETLKGAPGERRTRRTGAAAAMAKCGNGK